VPYKPKKPCGHRGCPKLTRGRYCEEHAKLKAKQYNRFHRDPDSYKRYGGAWKKIRAAFLKANPLCELCRERGRFTPATLVHHKRKLTDGGTNDWSNLQALCDSCHSSLHAGNGDYFKA
jgi:5-methylcytosine-specific restriction protein A